MAQTLAQSLPEYRARRYWIAFNLTGGFKSAQGFMQAMAMLYADESVYLFETGHELLRLPRLPVRLDTDAVVREHLELFRRYACDMAVAPSELAALPETLVDLEGEVATLSPWGDVAWADARSVLYRERLHKPLSARLRWSPRFERQVGALPADRRDLINRRLDDLARWLESGGKFNPASLDVKKLKAATGKSTHECDAWSDADAKRLFAHWEGEYFVIDRLDDGLH